MPPSDLTPRPSLGFSASLKWPPVGTLRRTRTGAWKLNGKTYRTRALAYVAAQRQGLWVVGDWGAESKLHAVYPNPPCSLSNPWLSPPAHGGLNPHKRGVFVAGDPYMRPGSALYLRVSGDQAGTFTSSPDDHTVRAKGWRVDGVVHSGSAHAGMRSIARLVEVPKDPEPAS